MSKVRVKRKGQVTIPVELRTKLGIEEGTILEAKEHSQGILLQLKPPPEAGKAVGEEEYHKLIKELDETRRGWR